MTGKLRITLTQFHAGPDVDPNLSAVLHLIEDAARRGSDLVAIPENALCLGSGDHMRANAQSPDGPVISAIRERARQCSLAVFLGGFKRIVEGEPKLRNTALLIDATGEIRSVYDKVHVFNANVGGQSFRASDIEKGGIAPVVAVLGGVKLGLTICYDVRFPELYRRLARAGVHVFLVPAAFVHATGRAGHWETLLRARAIENGAYVVASALMGSDGDSFRTFGHAMVVDPWGKVVTDLGERDYALETVTIDTTAVKDARSKLPVLEQLQPGVYDAPIEETQIALTAEAPALARSV